jgi:integral membrane protein
MMIRNTPLGRFRLVALAEGVSYLALLGIGMPLKYAMDMPTPNLWIGWAHGALFIAYLVFGLHAAIVQRWSLFKVFAAFIASLIPFGTFVLEAKIRDEIDRGRSK